MEFLIISGLSGAGKTRAADVMEDLDYYCVDNMPAALLPTFAELCMSAVERYEKVALVVDAREKDSMNELFEALAKLWDVGCEYSLLFLEADVQTIVKRYQETRRPHPLYRPGESLEMSIRREIKLLEPLRERADYVINTTGLTQGQLQKELYSIFVGENSKRQMAVSVVAFGFKYGIPIDADMVFDVRFLPNPFYVDELRELTGLDKPVQEFVLEQADAMEFLNKVKDLIAFLLPRYIDEGKHRLTIAVGCTGGQHRSVAVAHELTEFINNRLGQNASLTTRELGRDKIGGEHR